MNRKTATILCAAGGLAAAAAVLGARTPQHSSTPKPPIHVNVEHRPDVVAADECTADTSPARLTSDFGPGSMTAALSGTHVLMNGDGEMHLSVDLTAREGEAGERPPLSVAIVVDRSGSMSGEKIDKAREAARGLVTRLHDGDRAAIVQFDDRVQVLVPSTATDESGKRRLLAAIDSIQPGGSTNLNEGLLRGRDEVLRELAEGYVNRVILLSDGRANVGVTDIPSLARSAGDAAERGLRITTVGLGTDYNEDLMEAVAENGRGRYYYVKDAAGLEPVFAGELKAIQGTVVTKAEVRLEPSCAGVEIAEVYGYTVRREGNAVIVPLSDLAGGDQRKIVARLKVPVARRGHQGVVKATLSYTGIKGGARQATVAALGVDVTEDTAAVIKNADKQVMTKVAQVESAVALRRAAEVYQAGDQAAAVRTIQEAQKSARKRAEVYDLPAKDMTPVMGQLDTTGAGMASTPAASPAAPAVTKGAKADALYMAK